MTQQQLRDLVRASNPVVNPDRLLLEEREVLALYGEAMLRSGNPQISADLLDQPVERRRDMQTQERPAELVAERKIKPPRKWLAAAAAFAIVIVLGVVGLMVANRDGDPNPANPATTAVPTTEGPLIDATQGAAALIGRNWTVVDGRSGSRPDTIEFAADGSYQVFDTLPVARGQSTTDGDVITFEAAPTDEVTWVHNDAFLRVTNSCEGVVGQYRVVFTGGAQVTLEVISDGCPTRVGTANGLVLEPKQP